MLLFSNFLIICSDEQDLCDADITAMFNVHSSHLSLKHPFHENIEGRMSQKVTPKKTADLMNSWHSFSASLSFLHHISAVGLTGHHNIFT